MSNGREPKSCWDRVLNSKLGHIGRDGIANVCTCYAIIHTASSRVDSSAQVLLNISELLNLWMFKLLGTTTLSITTLRITTFNLRMLSTAIKRDTPYLYT
jgi:hypothetical protein